MELKGGDDPVFKTSWMPRKIVADLLLLENQLPWCVLVCLFNLITTNDSTTTEYQNSLLNDLVAVPFSTEYRIFYYYEHRRNRLGTQKHLLDYFRNYLVGSCTIKRPDQSPPASSVHPEWIPIQSVTELLDLGISFVRAPDGGNFLDVKFEDGKMKMPAIVIEENTECLFRNLIAFEHCDPSKGYEITSYASLLDCLIKSPADALHLEQKHILRIVGLSNEDRASFLKRLLYNNDTSFHGFLYSDLCQDVNKICFDGRRVWAEYRSMALTVTELYWIRMLFKELGFPLHSPPCLWVDNIGALSLSSNPVFHARTKHIEVDYHFIREKIFNRDILAQYISTISRPSDIFTKGLSNSRFHMLKDKLMVRPLTISLKGAVNQPIQNTKESNLIHCTEQTYNLSNGISLGYVLR